MDSLLVESGARSQSRGRVPVAAFMDFPNAHWRKIHATNVLERENRELRRRIDVVDIFPERASVLRLLGSLLLDKQAEWVSVRIADVWMDA